LAVSISTAAVASAATGTGTALTLIQIMAKAKIGIAAAVVVAVAIPVAMQVQSNRKLRAENEALRAQAAQIEQLSAENARLAKLAQGSGAPTPAASNDPSREMLKLRGEVGRLKTEANAPKPSPLSAVISDPETRRMIREQQKMGMGMIYKEFGTRMKLSPELSQKFVDLLADDIMENVDHVGALLRDGKSREEIDQVFTAQEAAMLEKVKALLGPEELSQYQDYTKNLAGFLTAEQFKGEMSGDKAAKNEKSKQLYEVMQQETQAVLDELGLSADFQTLPILNFRNIASEQEAERNLRLMETIYERAARRVPSFLNPDEVKKFDEFRAIAVSNSRAALTMNRRMMAPGGK